MKQLQVSQMTTIEGGGNCVAGVAAGIIGGALAGARIGAFVAQPWWGAGIGAIVGGAAGAISYC